MKYNTSHEVRKPILQDVRLSSSPIKTSEHLKRHHKTLSKICFKIFVKTFIHTEPLVPTPWEFSPLLGDKSQIRHEDRSFVELTFSGTVTKKRSAKLNFFAFSFVFSYFDKMVFCTVKSIHVVCKWFRKILQ